MEDWQLGGFGLYLHWPYCQSKCPYCDFNSHVIDKIDQSRWQTAYLREIDRLGERLRGRVLDSIYFGGGTPSMMDPSLVYAIIERIRATWPMRNQPEITLEANPTSVEAGRFRGYRDAGVNRVSMGIQALNDVDLKRLGRLHSVAEALKALEIANETFDRVNFDLIYARQDQSLSDWRGELNRAIGYARGHLSLYQLTIEDGTAFGERFAKGGLAGLPGEDLSADMYEVTQDCCEAAGLAAYEISNHASEANESRHNLVYWRGGDYVGIGPGAHGRLTLDGQRTATVAPKPPLQWLRRVEDGLPGEDTQEQLTDAERADEFLIMGLRLSEGLSLGRYEAISGKALNADILDHLQELSLISVSDQRLRVLRPGRMVLNSIIRALAQ